MSDDASNCPVTGGANNPTAGRGPSNRDWWPNQLNLGILHQNPPAGDPMGEAIVVSKKDKTSFATNGDIVQRARAFK